MKYLIVVLIFISSCASSRPPEMMAIVGIEPSSTVMDVEPGEVGISYFIHVTKNIKHIRIFYDYRRTENLDWDRKDYVSYLTVPKEAVTDATKIVGVEEQVYITANQGQLKATIVASNMSFNRPGFGSSVNAHKIFDIEDYVKN